MIIKTRMRAKTQWQEMDRDANWSGLASFEAADHFSRQPPEGHLRNRNVGSSIIVARKQVRMTILFEVALLTFPATATKSLHKLCNILELFERVPMPQTTVGFPDDIRTQLSHDPGGVFSQPHRYLLIQITMT